MVKAVTLESRKTDKAQKLVCRRQPVDEVA